MSGRRAPIVTYHYEPGPLASESAQKRILAKFTTGRKSAAWAHLVAFYSFTCAYCGRIPDRIHSEYRTFNCDHPMGLEADHFYPAHVGGSGQLSNILPACPQCNNAKGHKLPWEWLGYGEFRAFVTKHQRFLALVPMDLQACKLGRNPRV